MRGTRWLSKMFTAAVILTLISFPSTPTFADPLETSTESVPAVELLSEVPATADATPAPAATPPAEDPSGAPITIANGVVSEAQSGDASVTDNNSAGDATSGDAAAEANVLTVVSSATSFDGSSLPVFSLHITGDTAGDILLDTAVLTQPNINSPSAVVVTDHQDNIQIINKVTVAAASGNATIMQNGTAGDATSGNATTTANVINIINSSVSARQSFLGVINVDGNLTGDILVPAEFLSSVLSPAAQLPEANNPSGVALQQSINNEISISAQSGNASVTNNRIAGDATSGNASTHVTSLNLINAMVTGGNVMMVFVNVLGQWNGTLMGLPDGSTSLVLGTKADYPQDNSTETSIEVNIDNQISVAATSGNARVESNINAGNATSGNARAVVNLLNIINASISSADWFGVLFINVFGSWTGNFGALAPPPVVPPTAEPPATSPVPAPAHVNYQRPKNIATPQPPPIASQSILAAAAQSPAIRPAPSITSDTQSSNVVPTLIALAAVLIVTASFATLRRNPKN